MRSADRARRRARLLAAAGLALLGLALAILHRRLGGPLHLSPGMVLASVPVFLALVLAAPGPRNQERVVYGTGLHALGALLSGLLFVLTGSPLAAFLVSPGGMIALLLTWPAVLGAALACAWRLAPCL